MGLQSIVTRRPRPRGSWIWVSPNYHPDCGLCADALLKTPPAQVPKPNSAYHLQTTSPNEGCTSNNRFPVAGMDPSEGCAAPGSQGGDNTPLKTSALYRGSPPKRPPKGIFEIQGHPCTWGSDRATRPLGFPPTPPPGRGQQAQPQQTPASISRLCCQPFTVETRGESKPPSQCHTGVRRAFKGSSSSALPAVPPACHPRHPTESQLELATRRLHKAAPLAPPHTAPAITASATSSLPPPLPRPPPRPDSAPDPARPGVPRGGGTPRKRRRGSANGTTHRHGGGRFPDPGPAGAAMSPPGPGDPSAPNPGAPVPRRRRCRSRPPARRRSLPWWRMAVDSPKQIRAGRVAPRMAATTAEENVDVNTRPFIGRSRLGGSSDRAAGAGREETPCAGARKHSSG